MSNYFSNFPKITYQGVQARDITRRSAFVDSLLANPYVFLPYTVKENEKPEDIAYHYYGSVDLTWIVLLANQIIDPYTQWPLSSENFTQKIISQYAEQSGQTGYDVVAWTQNETSVDNILYYYKTTDTGKTIRASLQTFPYIYNEQGDVIGQDVSDGWVAYRIYQYELDMNDSLREIQLVGKTHIEQISREFKKQICE